VVEPYPSEKYEFVSWDYYSQYMESHKKMLQSPPTRMGISMGKESTTAGRFSSAMELMTPE